MPNKIYKAILLCIFVLSNTFLSLAQTEYLVTVNPSTGSITKIDSIPAVKLLRGGYMSSYSQINHQYTFVGGKDVNNMNFITVDALTGHTIYHPPFNNQLNFANVQYKRDGSLLYISPFPPSASLSFINPLTAANTLFKNYPEMLQILQVFPDDIHNRIYVSASDASTNGERAIFTLEMNTGNILSRVPADNILSLEYNYSTNIFYGLYYNTTNHPPTYNLCTFDPTTGIRNDLSVIPGLVNVEWGNQALDEVGGHYFVSASQYGDTSRFLNTLKIETGNLISKVVIPQVIDGSGDNLVQFKYDQTLNKLYALFWEAKTIIPPTPVIDSSCKLSTETRVYPNPFTGSFYIDKKVTRCTVLLNVYNNIGQLVIKNKEIHDGGNEIAFPNLSAGIYHYKLISDGDILFSGKILKQ